VAGAKRPDTDPFGLLMPMLELLGDITNRRVLDAGCGEGYLARALADRGARVTGIDLSPRLIEQARDKDPDGRIDYQVADLSQTLPAMAGSFHAAASAVIDRHVADYFDSGAVSPYRGLWEAGIKAYYHHRTLEDYLDAFQAGGLRLIKLADIAALAGSHKPDAYLPPGGRFPRFMLLAFRKPIREQ